MTAKIFRSSLFIGILVLLLCLGVFFGIMYDVFQTRAFSELKLEAEYIAKGVAESGEEYLENLTSRERVTWVAGDGTVLYDSAADASSMENHLGREEIAQALETGEGKSEHYSNTLLEKNLYYALLSPDGTVLRVSCTQSSVAAMLIGLIQPVLWLVIAVLVLSGLLASRLARQITKPINDLDLDHPESCEPYREISPLVERIREQNRTIQRQMEELVSRQREFEAITSSMSEGFLLFGRKSNVVSGNPSAKRMLERFPQDIRACAESALAGERNEKNLELDGRTFQILARPVISSGQVTGAVAISMDITEREQLEGLRREFTANVSHELKTPLTSISGFAELMKEGLVPQDKMKEFAGDIYSESKRLITLVDDIIRLSRLDEGAAQLEWEDVNLSEVTAETLESLKPAAEKRGVRLETAGSAEPVQAVRRLVSEMIYNICENAIKYNKENGLVSVKLSDTGDCVRVSVADTGIGIPYASQKRVFERFYRVDKSHSKAIGGTGLGLSIVKHAAGYLDARVELSSVPGEGTTVTMIFKKEKQ